MNIFLKSEVHPAIKDLYSTRRIIQENFQTAPLEILSEISLIDFGDRENFTLILSVRRMIFMEQVNLFKVSFILNTILTREQTLGKPTHIRFLLLGLINCASGDVRT